MVVKGSRPVGRKRQSPEGSGRNHPATSSPFIDTITALKRKSRKEEAQEMLMRIGYLVSPVMKTHGLKVKVLCEFYPKNGNLLGLNVNGGAKICLRLRPANDESRFYDLEHCIGVMLHELSHNKHGPHNAAFYSYMDTLKETYEAAVISGRGFVGNPMYSAGQRVGVGVSHDVPMAEARQKMLKAIEARRKTFTGGTSVLGGERLRRPLRELVREAAERRQKDSLWCGEGKGDNDELGLEAEEEAEVPETSERIVAEEQRKGKETESQRRPETAKPPPQFTNLETRRPTVTSESPSATSEEPFVISSDEEAPSARKRNRKDGEKSRSPEKFGKAEAGSSGNSGNYPQKTVHVIDLT